MNAYLAQGFFPLKNAVTALCGQDKDKKIIVMGVPGPVVLEWGIWEVPDAENDDLFIPPRGFA